MRRDHQLRNDFELPIEQQQMVERELRDGEDLLWVGKPKPIWFRNGILGQFLFAIPWTSFAIFWVASAAQAGGGFGGVAGWIGFVFPLFGVPFILIGLGMLSSPLRDLVLQKRTVYAMTDQRAFVFSGIRSVKIETYEDEELTGSSRTMHRDGTGDVTTDYGLSFERIEKPDLIQKLIDELGDQYLDGSDLYQNA